MFRELFQIPFTHLTVKSYGTMVVIGLIAAIILLRRFAKFLGHNPEHVTNAAVYSVISGIVGARIFYVIHYYDQFRGDFLRVFAVWTGGLELLGGVFAAFIVILIYLKIHKLPILDYLDVLAIALLLALSFGRVGCFLNGCCFGKPTSCSLGIVFPYDSPPYESQVFPDENRNRPQARLDLPAEYYGNIDEHGHWLASDEEHKFYFPLKPRDMLNDRQLRDVARDGKYHAHPVHPTQLYTSAMALFWWMVLFFFWKRYGKGQKDISKRRRFANPGCTFGVMFVLYGLTRFMIEYVRDDNPFETAWWTLYKGGTISQNISLVMIIIGIVSWIVFSRKRIPN